MSVYGIIKPVIDAHTMGIMNCVELLTSCDRYSIIANEYVAKALEKVEDDKYYEILKQWIKENELSHLIISFRLDPEHGFLIFARLFNRLCSDRKEQFFRGGQLKHIYFAGLPDTCVKIKNEFGDNIILFQGDESPLDTLRMLEVPENEIPDYIKESTVYDSLLLDFGRQLIESEKYHQIRPTTYDYPEYGTDADNIIARWGYAQERGLLPLVRAHAGPYSDNREEALAEYSNWLRQLAHAGYLDIMSVGSSQLSQSNFGEDWKGMNNGGGIPFNSFLELRAMREDASPMLIRAYSGTKDVLRYAQMLDRQLGNAWHALSVWWFNQIDGRGSLCVKESIQQHVETIDYMATHDKVFEPNVSHHFAFRGADDLTYIVTAYLAVKLAKLRGVEHVILQNMLNTPKSTWYLNDIVKSRVLLRMVRSLEDNTFHVLYQPRAGLDYFSPDLDKAKAQLASVTALMMDINPSKTPDIIHVVSYSEAMFLATPPIINDSIKIVKSVIREYPAYRKKMEILEEFVNTNEMLYKEEALYNDTKKFIEFIERNFLNLYSPEGFYKLLTDGYFPLPYLWSCKDEFENAMNWSVRNIKGAMAVIGPNGLPMTVDDRIEKIRNFQN